MFARLGLCACLASGAVAVHAAPYAEIRGGLSQMDDLSGTADRGGGVLEAEFTYDAKKTIGAEGGMRAIAGTPFALALALDGFRGRLGEATLSQTGAAAESPAGGQGTQVALDADGVRDLGYNFDDRVTVLSGNAYYELGDEEGLVAYLGLGYGIASIESDLRSGFVIQLGARYPIDPIGYVGLRVSRFQSDGHNDAASGLQFEDFASTAVTLAFGLEF
ncbi:MAG: hypothetical protein OXH15_05070 [Gammaproteobacteria bacterium]|nr:hypothetical protein [Gammaproteobacteria bacterium]